MDLETYKERKGAVLSLITKAKAKNIELGEYLEKHIIWEDKNRTLMYTGANSVLEDLMNNPVTDSNL